MIRQTVECPTFGAEGHELGDVIERELAAGRISTPAAFSGTRTALSATPYFRTVYTQPIPTSWISTIAPISVASKRRTGSRPQFRGLPRLAPNLGSARPYI